ncbi:unnamed protein product [Darwinula stevensoni]|uniref:ubiquitinyl hydrolase 1 n=1 Tax=Darwinula stevensoni TaxID=69355 RepID=A0A7R9A012_9CRUS|nr:unnamed protein product [Darwinula stevensoni]CAG0880036.1 unnamed protein product [Darwinula stevensoni]
MRMKVVLCVTSALFLILHACCASNETSDEVKECCPDQVQYGVYDRETGAIRCESVNGTSTNPSLSECSSKMELVPFDQTDRNLSTIPFCQGKFHAGSWDGSNGTFIQGYLFCLSEAEREKTDSRILIRKCCPLGEGYSRVWEKCLPLPFDWTFPVFDPETEEIRTSLPSEYRLRIDDLTSISCHKYFFPLDTDHDFVSLENGELYSRAANSTYSNEQFCLDYDMMDESKVIQARICHPIEKKMRECEGKACVQKCCPENDFVYLHGGRIRCRPAGRRWDPRNYSRSDLGLNRSEKEIRVIAGLPMCVRLPSIYMYLMPNSSRNPDDDFSLMQTTGLILKGYRNFVVDVPRYCIDDTGNSSETLEPIAVVCYPDFHEIFRVAFSLILATAVVLLVTFIFGLFSHERKSLTGKISLFYVGCLVISSSAECMSLVASFDLYFLCLVYDLVLIYASLAAFCWLNVMGFHVWRNFSVPISGLPEQERRNLLHYCLYAFGLPALLVAIVFSVGFAPGIVPPFIQSGEYIKIAGFCMIIPVYPALKWCFYGLMASLLVINAVFFALTSRYLIQHSRNTAYLARSREQKLQFWLYVKLFVLMGGTWLIAIIGHFTMQNLEFAYVTYALTGLQGFFVFLIFVCKKETTKCLKTKGNDCLSRERKEVPFGKNPRCGERGRVRCDGAMAEKQQDENSRARIGDQRSSDPKEKRKTTGAVGEMSALHCLNSLLQGEYHTTDDLAVLAQRTTDSASESEEFRGFVSDPLGYDSGQNSILVMSKALELWNLTLIPFSSDCSKAVAAREYPMAPTAYICICHHDWFAIRKLGYQWFNLNSMLSEPEMLSETHLSLLLAQLEADEYSAAFIVDGFLPQCEADDILRITPAVQATKQKLNSQPENIGGDWDGNNREEDPELRQALEASMDETLEEQFHEQLTAALALSRNMVGGRSQPEECTSALGYSAELSEALQDVSKLDEAVLSCWEAEMVDQFQCPKREEKWREGVAKSAFTYLLLDPRLTQNLPARTDLCETEKLRIFVSSVFYIGKGKQNRPYHHLYQALRTTRSQHQEPLKAKRIQEIWGSEQGVVLLQVFHSVIPVEAYSREAAMIDAIAKENVRIYFTTKRDSKTQAASGMVTPGRRVPASDRDASDIPLRLEARPSVPHPPAALAFPSFPFFISFPQQQGQLCAQHCLNALLQGEYFTAVDLAALAEQMDIAEQQRMAESGLESEEFRRFMSEPSGNMDDSGYFSVQVISSALQLWELVLIPFNSGHDKAIVARSDPTTATAYICNYRNHWFAIRKLGYQWFNLNSMLTGPELLSDTHLSIFLAQLAAEGYSIFIVDGFLPQSEADDLLRITPAVQTVKPKLISQPDKDGDAEEDDLELRRALKASMEDQLEEEYHEQLAAALDLSKNMKGEGSEPNEGEHNGAGGDEDEDALFQRAYQLSLSCVNNEEGSQVPTPSAAEIRERRRAFLDKVSSTGTKEAM